MAIKITEEKKVAAVGVKALSLSYYVEKALKRAEYYRDANGVVIAKALQLGYWLLGKKEDC